MAASYNTIMALIRSQLDEPDADYITDNYLLNSILMVEDQLRADATQIHNFAFVEPVDFDFPTTGWYDLGNAGIFADPIMLLEDTSKDPSVKIPIVSSSTGILFNTGSSVISSEIRARAVRMGPRLTLLPAGARALRAWVVFQRSRLVRDVTTEAPSGTLQIEPGQFESPSIPPQFHELLVWGVCKRAAQRDDNQAALASASRLEADLKMSFLAHYSVENWDGPELVRYVPVR